MAYMDNFKIVYSVDGEEHAAEVEGRRGIDDFLAMLEVGTLYRLYGWRNDAWIFLEQHKTQPPARPWGLGSFPD